MRCCGPMIREDAYPFGAAVTLEALERDPHPVLAELRAREPVSWLPGLDGWLVTRYDLAAQVMRDPLSFTVDDPRFSTAQVVGPSMLSLDGDGHARHRDPFVAPFRLPVIAERFSPDIALESERLIDQLLPGGKAELRRSFAGPLAASIVTRALGLDADDGQQVLGWYDAIVGAVGSITAGHGNTAAGRDAFDALRRRLLSVLGEGDGSSLLVERGLGRDPRGA